MSKNIKGGGYVIGTPKKQNKDKENIPVQIMDAKSSVDKESNI